MKAGNFLPSIVILWFSLAMAACTAAPGPAHLPTSTSAAVSQTIPARTPALPSPASTPAASPTASPTSAPAPLPTRSPQELFGDISQNSRVAFYNESTNQICVMNGDGSGQLCLDLNQDNFANGYPAAGFLALSPGGASVAYAAECNIYIWTPGKGVTALRDGHTCGIFMQPDWSPDGKFIAYTSQELERIAPSGQVYLTDVFLDSLDGTVHRRLTAEAGGSTPAWSPDGRRIAFSSGGISVYSLDTDQAIDLTPGLSGGNPGWSPDGQFIAFTRQNEASIELYMMPSDGSGSRKVAELGFKPIWPYAAYTYTWLPGGKYILYHDQLIHTITGKSDPVSLPFDSIHESWSMTAGNEAFVPLPSPTPRPTLDPSSGQIAFTACTSDDSNSCEIYVMNADGSELLQLTNNDDEDSKPDWSPDGKKIVFESSRDGNSEIYVMNSDGTGQTRLTENSSLDDSPVWSPDGTKIAFVSYRDQANTSYQGHAFARLVNGPALPGDEIYVMNADGSNQIRLTENTASDSGPDWSPDGNKIVFISDRDGGDDIYVMNADGSDPIRLTDTTMHKTGPAWSPDGAKIAFEFSFDIFTLDANLTGTVFWNWSRLTSNSARDSNPAWSPDGTKIIFASDRYGSSQIFVMNTDGSQQTMLTEDSYRAFSPAWGPATFLSTTEIPAPSLPDCASGWTRLAARSVAKVSEASATPNRVRSGPSTAEETFFLIYPGAELNIIEGPICADRLVFWKVETEAIPGGQGWTTEGDGVHDWLDP